MSIKDIQNEIIDEFSLFEDWMQKYEYLIELGKDLPIIDSALSLAIRFGIKNVQKNAVMIIFIIFIISFFIYS